MINLQYDVWYQEDMPGFDSNLLQHTFKPSWLLERIKRRAFTLPIMTRRSEMEWLCKKEQDKGSFAELSLLTLTTGTVCWNRFSVWRLSSRLVFCTTCFDDSKNVSICHFSTQGVWNVFFSSYWQNRIFKLWKRYRNRYYTFVNKVIYMYKEIQENNSLHICFKDLLAKCLFTLVWVDQS